MRVQDAEDIHSTAVDVPTHWNTHLRRAQDTHASLSTRVQLSCWRRRMSQSHGIAARRGGRRRVGKVHGRGVDVLGACEPPPSATRARSSRTTRGPQAR